MKKGLYCAGRSLKEVYRRNDIVIEQNENQFYLVLMYAIMRYVIRHVVFVSLVRGYLDFTIYCNVFFEKNKIPLASLYYVHLFRLR